MRKTGKVVMQLVICVVSLIVIFCCGWAVGG